MFESLLSWVVWNREFVMLSMEQNSRSGFSLLKTPGKLLSVCLSVCLSRGDEDFVHAAL